MDQERANFLLNVFCTLMNKEAVVLGLSSRRAPFDRVAAPPPANAQGYILSTWERFVVNVCRDSEMTGPWHSQLIFHLCERSRDRARPLPSAALNFAFVNVVLCDVAKKDIVTGVGGGRERRAPAACYTDRETCYFARDERLRLPSRDSRCADNCFSFLCSRDLDPREEIEIYECTR
ncbi:hypothetical protein EVAR_37324_1 [Eumeta japonica]|uniref:Uncharacterized protein n=1 Tax=Eumeta variegata TaxID=151549 RepID=A0A4C1X1K6_EUMVA|nr:hypothetical protein EVAR_37324_1 [Eumeta japonica]